MNRVSVARQRRSGTLPPPTSQSLPVVDIDSADRVAIAGAALRVFDALGCAGVARIDFFLTDDGPVLNEVNTMPGMTAESQVPRMFAAAGLAYEQLVTRLVDAATVPGGFGTSAICRAP